MGVRKGGAEWCRVKVEPDLGRSGNEVALVTPSAFRFGRNIPFERGEASCSWDSRVLVIFAAGDM